MSIRSSYLRRSRALRLAALLALLPMLLSVPRFSASAHATLAKGPWTIGVSNDLIGNGWREEMVCSVKAEAASTNGLVNKVIVVENQLDTAKQISQIRDLISAGVNAIIIDPPDATSLNGVIQQAVSRGIVVVVVDQLVTSKLPYQAENDQVAYGRLGMEWLARQLHGHGNVVVLRGIAGAPADTDRETGIKQALKEYPGIHIVAETFTNWQFATGGSQMLTLLNSHKKIDGVWTSGIDYTVVQAFITAHRKFVPIVGADNNEFVHQLVTLHGQGLVGAAVTNPPPIGGVGAAIAIKVLQGQSVPKLTKLTPEVWDYAHSLAVLKSHYLPSQAASYGAQWGVPGYTHYKVRQIFACKV